MKLLPNWTIENDDCLINIEGIVLDFESNNKTISSTVICFF